MRIFTDAFLSEFKPLSVIIIKYGRISKTKDSKAKPVRKGKDISKQKSQQASKRNTRKQTTVKRPKICSQNAQGKAKGKETGKATLHKKTYSKSGQALLRIYSPKRQGVRPMPFKIKPYMRSFDKARKALRKMGRD